jgi:hypothetical protein
MTPTTTADWVAVTERNARIITTLVGWIWWDPGALDRYRALGVDPALAYCAVRGAPLAPAGDDAVIAAFYTINPDVVRASLADARQHTTFDLLWAARDDAVIDGLRTHAPTAVDALAELAPMLRTAADACAPAGRTLFGACRALPLPDHPTLIGWHLVNLLREWRGDTHFALVVSEGLDPVEASILHNAWMRYPPRWIPRSRIWTDHHIDDAYRRLTERGLARYTDGDWQINDTGLALREHIEIRTDQLTSAPWRAVGADAADRFHQLLRDANDQLLDRIDRTAGPHYQPASRLHPR